MTAESGGTWRTVAFGDLEAGLWGAAVAAGPRPPVLILGAGEQTASGEVSLRGDAPHNAWQITGQGVELVATAVDQPVPGTGTERGRPGFHELCHVSGRFNVAGTQHEVNALGVRGVRDVGLDADGFQAVREVAAWFEPSEGLVLAAARPRGAKGQDADVISAAVLNPESAAPVEDARLSTTYGGDGWITRAGLELWLDGDEDQQLLRRAAGEAVGARGLARAGDLELRAELFRWNSGGHGGSGVYLLARRR